MVVVKGHHIVVFSALTVLGSKVVLLPSLNPVCDLPFEVLKTYEPGYPRVVGARVKLFSGEAVM
jgi:hypothetical protein